MSILSFIIPNWYQYLCWRLNSQSLSSCVMTNYTLQNRYYYLRIRLTFQGNFFFFHVKPSIAIKTKISESVLKNIEKRASYLLKRIFGKKVCILTCHKNDSKSIFAAKHLGSWNSIAYTCPRFSFTVWSLLSVYNWTVNRETEKRMRVAIRNSKRRQAGSERNIKESWRGMAKISYRDGLGLVD